MIPIKGFENDRTWGWTQDPPMRKANKVIVSAGLLDRFENCIVYAPVEKVEAVTSA